MTQSSTIRSSRCRLSATDEEIKDAYRKLAKKYHPDQYGDSRLSELAGEKMKEINEAYDTIVSQRKTRGANNNGAATTTITRTMRVIMPVCGRGSSASGFNDNTPFHYGGAHCRRGADLKRRAGGKP